VRKWAIEPGRSGNENEKLVVDADGARADICSISKGGSTAIEFCSVLPVSTASGAKVNEPSANCLNIRFTAIMPAAPVNAAKSAPT
jgi:hypothetical protein